MAAPVRGGVRRARHDAMTYASDSAAANIPSPSTGKARMGVTAKANGIISHGTKAARRSAAEGG